MSNHLNDVTDADFDSVVLQSDKPVIVGAKPKAALLKDLQQFASL
ncbi:hypothetical protein ACIA49_41810 [Kribbella sp. NPDC051587]